MSLLSDVVAIADSVTKSLGFQASVTHQAWIGQGVKGGDVYAAAVSRKAVVDLKRRQLVAPGNRLITIVATITFLETVASNGTVTNPPRQEPIDPRDIITLPDGTTGPIISVPDSVIDPENNKPALNTVYLGEVATNP